MRSPIATTGNIASKIDTGTGRDGKTWARFRLGTNERVRDADGNWTDAPGVFVDVTTFGKAAQATVRTFEKGDRVAVIGDLILEPYVGRDGNTRQGTKIIAETIAADPLFTEVIVERRPQTVLDRDFHGPDHITHAHADTAGAYQYEPQGQAATWPTVQPGTVGMA